MAVFVLLLSPCSPRGAAATTRKAGGQRDGEKKPNKRVIGNDLSFIGRRIAQRPC